MHVSKGDKRRWLLIYNCHAMGLSNCLGALSDEVEVETHNRHTLQQNAASLIAQLQAYDRVLVAPRFADDLGLTGDEANVWIVPTIQFRAYHPDTCYIARNSEPRLKGPLGEYHSLISLAAFQMGLTARDAGSLYREEVYRALGYLDLWSKSREHLASIFRAHDFDIESRFVDWSRRGAFMHTINHPKIECLLDLASSILSRSGMQPKFREVVPHDNLANGPIFPVYPEIGDQLGVKGTYAFKVGGAYRFLELDDFIGASYSVYEQADLRDLVPTLTATVSSARRAIEALL